MTKIKLKNYCCWCLACFQYCSRSNDRERVGTGNTINNRAGKNQTFPGGETLHWKSFRKVTQWSLSVSSTLWLCTSHAKWCFLLVNSTLDKADEVRETTSEPLFPDIFRFVKPLGLQNLARFLCQPDFRTQSLIENCGKFPISCFYLPFSRITCRCQKINFNDSKSGIIQSSDDVMEFHLSFSLECGKISSQLRWPLCVWVSYPYL